MKKKLSVLIGGSPPLFSDRLIHSLRVSGLEIEELSLPRGKVAFAKWFCGLARSKAKIVHYLWGKHYALIYMVPKFLGKKVVVHWIGSDVLYSISNDETPFQRLLQRMAYRMIDLHLTVSASLADELKPLGIKATVIPLVPHMPAFNKCDTPWPSANKVYVYLREAKQEFYGSEIVFRLAQEMADTEFMITGHSGRGAPQMPNLKFLGWVDDIETMWREVKVYLRLTKHDGMPQTLIEALTRGKYVVWSNQFPHCLYARSFDEAKEALRSALAQKQPNIAGMAYARQEFDPSKIIENLKQEYLRLVS